MNGTDYDFDFSGHGDMNNRFVPDRATAFKSDKSWLKIDGGQHHSIALDGTGKMRISHLLIVAAFMKIMHFNFKMIRTFSK